MKILRKNKWRKEVHERDNAKQDLPLFSLWSLKRKRKTNMEIKNNEKKKIKETKR